MKRFWDKVKKTDACWIWIAAKDLGGYGFFKIKNPRKMVRAHRLSWEMANGPIAKGLYVCHACDNPSCVRPDHLWIGTNADNLRDMAKKRRSTIGEKNPSSKITSAQVIKIRNLYFSGNFSQEKIGKKFGIGQSQISRIVRNKIWTSV